MKKKIVIVVEAMLGGVRKHILDVVEYLDKENYEIYIVYSDYRSDEIFEKYKNKIAEFAEIICCSKMKRLPGVEDFAAYKELVEIIRDIKPDIVHCHSSKAGVLGRLAAKKCKVPLIIYTPHAYAFQNPEIPLYKKKFYIFSERFLSWYATSMTINVSKGEMQLARDYRIDKPEKFVLIYNGIPQPVIKEKNQIRKELGLNQDIFYVGCTARCTYQKDPYTYLRIAKNITTKNKRIEFIYVGDGEMKEKIQQWIIENKLEQKVHMLGFRTDAAYIVGAFDLYLSTALYEGLSYSMIEAMSAGIPIIATDTVGNNELVYEGKNGRLFPVGDVNEASRLIMEQFENNNIISDNVKEVFTKKFSVENMMCRLAGVYRTGG